MHDLIQIIEILSSEVVKKLNEYIDTLTFQPNTVFGEGEKATARTEVRSSTGCILSEDETFTKNLHLKMNAALEEYKDRVSKINVTFEHFPVPGGYDTNSWREAIQILDYREGQKYNMHHDTADLRRQEYYRTISIILYLNNDFEGGNTVFSHKKYKPLPGQALIFPSNWCYPHAGEPVTSGKKRVAVTWYYVEARTQDEYI